MTGRRRRPGRPGGGARAIRAVAVLVVAWWCLVLSACGSDLGAGDPTGGDEAETAVSNDDDGETLSLGEVRELVEQRAQEAGLGSGDIQCVIDYLDETFDAALAGEDAGLAIDEAFGACSTGPAPQVPLEPEEAPGGG